MPHCPNWYLLHLFLLWYLLQSQSLAKIFKIASTWFFTSTWCFHSFCFPSMDQPLLVSLLSYPPLQVARPLPLSSIPFLSSLALGEDGGTSATWEGNDWCSSKGHCSGDGNWVLANKMKSYHWLFRHMVAGGEVPRGRSKVGHFNSFLLHSKIKSQEKW